MAIINQLATSVAAISATLNVEIFNSPDASVHLKIYWGLTDGGTIIANWANSVDLGTFMNGNYSTALTNLKPGTVYYYTGYDVTNDLWGTVSGAPKSIALGTLNLHESIVGLSATGLRGKVRTPLGQNWVNPICPNSFQHSITGNLQTFASIIPWYSCNDASITFSYTKNGLGQLAYTQTWSTTNPASRTYSPTDQTYLPWQVGTGLTDEPGLTLTTTPLYQGIPLPAEAWIHLKGGWHFTIATNVNPIIANNDGGAAGTYKISLHAGPSRVGFIDAPHARPREFYNSRVSSGVQTGITAVTALRSTCFWVVYFVLGIDLSTLALGAIPNGSFIAAFTVDCTRT